MTKLIVAFRSFANVPINEFSRGIRITTCVCVFVCVCVGVCMCVCVRERVISRDEF
jgi:hypothetical protein